MPKLDNVLQYIVPRIVAQDFLHIWTALDTRGQCQLANTSRLFDTFVMLQTTFWEERRRYLCQDDSDYGTEDSWGS